MARTELQEEDRSTYTQIKGSRSYSDFLSWTLNPQKFSRVDITPSELARAEKAWFYYVCFRKRNQFSGRIDVDAPLRYVANGISGAGKSELLRNISAHFPKVIGVYGSGDDEVLADLRAHDYRDRVGGRIGKNLENWENGLIIGPRTTSVTSSWDYVTYDNLTLKDIERHGVIVCPRRIYPSLSSFFRGTERVVNVLQQREDERPVWFVKILEAANVLYARTTIGHVRAADAKAYLIFLQRELRHNGLALGLDSQYSVSMDKEIRVNAEYTFWKNMGSDRLPKDVNWMHGWVTPDGFAGMYPNEWVCKDKWGGVYLGTSKMPPWYRRHRENLYKTLDIKRDVGAPDLTEEPSDDNEDLELHQDIVKAYIKERTIKGAARESGHDRDTVRRVIKDHFVDKACSCYKAGT